MFNDKVEVNLQEKPRKVLIVRFSSMGDIILTTPVVRCLKQQLNCEVHYITKEIFSDLLKGNPYIDKLWTIQSDIYELKRELIAAQYDAVVDLHKSLRSWQLSWLLKKGAYRLDKLNFKKWLFVKFKLNYLPDIHIVDRYMDTLSQWNVENDGTGLDYFIKTNQLPEADSFLNNASEESVGLVLGAAHFTKIPPIQLYRDFCESYPGKIALIGGPAEQAKGEELASRYGNRIRNFAGKHSIDESAYILNRTSMVIAPDTGMMHISAALQKPIILIWGSTHPAFGMYPYYGVNSGLKHRNVERVGLYCRPCTKMGRATCPEGHFRCMKEHTVDDIMREVDGIRAEYLDS